MLDIVYLVLNNYDDYTKASNENEENHYYFKLIKDNDE